MPQLASLSSNYLAPAVRADGTQTVLKLGVLIQEFNTETESLRLFGDRGIVKLLEADESLGAILLKLLQPGTLLAGITDDQQAS